MLVIVGLMGCSETGVNPDKSSPAPDDAEMRLSNAQAEQNNVLEITAFHEGNDFGFKLSDSKIPSGWTTIKLDNETESTHFAFLHYGTEEFLSGMKEDAGEVSRQAYLDEIGIPFQEEVDPYFRGDIGAGTFFANLGTALPSWGPANRPIGGPGLTSGGKASKTTQYLKPGVYFVECYVLNEDGVFHVTNGMVEKLVVTDESSDAREPKPTMRISLSSDDGIEVADAQGRSGIRPGQHTVAVTFEDNKTQGGHDLHLIRLDDGTTIEEVNAWMDWPDVGPDGFYNTDEFGPALTSYHGNPGPQTWLGGVQDIQPPLPETAYFHTQLKPGEEYAWVSEIANPKARGFLKTFTVPFNNKNARR